MAFGGCRRTSVWSGGVRSVIAPRCRGRGCSSFRLASKALAEIAGRCCQVRSGNRAFRTRVDRTRQQYMLFIQKNSSCHRKRSGFGQYLALKGSEAPHQTFSLNNFANSLGVYPENCRGSDLSCYGSPKYVRILLKWRT